MVTENGKGGEYDSDDDTGIQEIDQLQNHGIGAADINKLKAAGYFTIASCLSATRKNLAKIKGFSEQKVEKLKEAAAKCAVGLFSVFLSICQYQFKI
ncbi:hypothetical protein BDZ91DRAFT_353188 [Kalaharituber pfeilii]|nr:hypothetical protein BDZ91DRAFT_353188 [Kalaharituber pfeilii]